MPQGLSISNTPFATGLTNFKTDNLKVLNYFIQLLKKEKRISEKVTPGFGVGNIIDLTASCRIKLELNLN